MTKSSEPLRTVTSFEAYFSKWQSRCFVSLAAASILVAGCSGQKYEVAEVDGVLVINGQPGADVHIEFVPDAGTQGPPSAADTDERGAFTLQIVTRDGDSQPGAIVGNHRVTLSDRRLSRSPDGRGVPIRFGPEFTLAGTTPLRQEVKPGKQSLRIEIPIAAKP